MWTPVRSVEHARGFSLYELLVTLAIASGVTTAGAGVVSVVHDTAQTAEINAFVSYLSLARSEAIVRGQHTVLCPSTDGQQCDAASGLPRWDRGALLFVDNDGNRRLDPSDQLLRVHRELGRRLTIKTPAGRSRVVYQPTGLASGTNVTFTFCDPRGTEKVRYVIVSNSGRPRVSSTPPDGKIDEATERCA